MSRRNQLNEQGSIEMRMTEQMKFEIALEVYGGSLHRPGAEFPPYMDELRTLFMAVKEQRKKGLNRRAGQSVNHMWHPLPKRPRK